MRTTGKHKGEQHWLDYLNQVKQRQQKHIADLTKLYRKNQRKKS